ncbi:hypothetical protein ACFC6U_20925 [Kitasatospora purpeofusca]|uniref:hypothetical protein n=1 Tax=Kitasatospora purpeofusca TaxID=67352 RepID=UPI0035DFCE46
MRRWVGWAVAGVCAAAGAGLVAVALWVDLETADKVASVVGALLALAGLAFTVRALLRERPPTTAAAAGASGSGTPSADTGGGAPAATAGGGEAVNGGAVREVRVRVEGGGVGAGGDITAAGTTRPTAPASDGDGGVPPRIDRRDVHVSGPGSVGAGGDIHGIDLNRNGP